LRPLRFSFLSLLGTWSLVLALVGFWGSFCAAREHVDGLDEGTPKWVPDFDENAARLVRHVCSGEIRREGRGAELLEFDIAAPLTYVRLGYELPPALVIDDLKLSLWFQSNQDGCTLYVQVVFPNQIDPTTGKNLTVPIDGDAYTKAGQWQKLECRDLRARVAKLLPQLRRRMQMQAGLKQDLDVRGAYVDAAIVRIQTERGSSQFVIDSLRLEGIVDAPPENHVRPVENTEPEARPEAEFHLDRLHVRGRPFFPRILPYRGEQTGDLARMRFNVVWVPDYQDGQFLEELDRVGLKAMAVPPRIGAGDGPRGNVSNTHLAPFGPETARILFWYLGTHIPPEKKREVAAWQDQIRNADRIYKRPLMGDVTGLERTYSRHLNLTSVSRSPLHTSFGFKNYRDWLIEHRNLAQPGSFFLTWIQTEPGQAQEEMRQAAGWSPQVVEPEQLRLQVYAALAAGCRGLGFWTHSSLEDDRPGAEERRLMLALLNMELELLEPLLATGTVSSQNPFTVHLPPSRNLKGAASPLAPGKGTRAFEAALNDRETWLRRLDEVKRDLDAAIINCSGLGMLVLPVWYATESQYAPGPMAANDAEIVVPGGGVSARFWEISTTAIDEVQGERIAGGKQITLKRFDTTAAVFATDNLQLIERLREKMRTQRGPAARISLELARAKLERVVEVDLELHKLGMGQPDAGWVLAATRDRLVRAENDLRAEHFHESRLASGEAMQLLRILQQVYWNDAVHGRMYSPVSSPHTLCFQTLPDHWRMIARFGRARIEGSRNVLRSGDFEDFDTMVAEGWKHEQTAIDGVRATAELYPRAHKGAYSLRLIAAPASGQDPPASIPERPVTVISPPVTVHKGQLVYISGWTKVTAPSFGNLDGAILYDSLAGPGAALRWRKTADWQKFELVREVTETSGLTLTMALTGLGEILFDELEIIPLDVESSSNARSTKNAPASGRTGPFDFLKRLPGFRGKTDPE
jgi:hypothetical protein